MTRRERRASGAKPRERGSQCGHTSCQLQATFQPASFVTAVRMTLNPLRRPSKQERIGEELPMSQPLALNSRFTRSAWAAAAVAVLLLATFTPVQWLRGRLPRSSSPSIALSAWIDPWESNTGSSRILVVPSNPWRSYTLPSNWREFDPLYPPQVQAPRSLDDLRDSPPDSWETVDAQELSSDVREQYELNFALPAEQ
jgi:hypothetical protein